MENQNVVYGINGPVVTVLKTKAFSMMEMVYVGEKKLVGEVITVTEEMTTIQVYEETTGLKPGDPVVGTGAPMNVLLGPGIITNIFDGIERPLQAIADESGAFISRGVSVSALDTEKEWDVILKVSVGDTLVSGQIYATLPETPVIEHRLIVPPKVSGKVKKVFPNGNYKLMDTVVVPFRLLYGKDAVSQVPAEVQRAAHGPHALTVSRPAKQSLRQLFGLIHLRKRQLGAAARDKIIHFQVHFVLEIPVKAGSRGNVAAHSGVTYAVPEKHQQQKKSQKAKQTSL